MNEIWRPLVDFERLYEVSSIGRIRSSYCGKNKIRKLQKSFRGYDEVTLFDDSSKRRRFFVHRLVAASFIENKHNKPFINHLNGVKDDNRVENLEWCTQSENVKHGYDKLGVKNHMTGKKGKLAPNYCKGRLIRPSRKVKCVTLNTEYDSAGEAGRALALSQPSISEVCRGVRSDLNGLKFIYLS